MNTTEMRTLTKEEWNRIPGHILVEDGKLKGIKIVCEQTGDEFYIERNENYGEDLKVLTHKERELEEAIKFEAITTDVFGNSTSTFQFVEPGDLTELDEHRARLRSWLEEGKINDYRESVVKEYWDTFSGDSSERFFSEMENEDA